MTRINLLSVTESRTSRIVGLDAGQRVTVACSIIFVLTGGAIGWRVWSLRQASWQVAEELAAARQGIARLAPVVAQVEALDRQRADLAIRIRLIEELRQRQNDPARMLDELSRAIPDGVWLSRLQHDDDTVLIQGHALGLGVLSDLMANLEASGAFAPPVQVVESRLSTPEQGGVVNFELQAVFRAQTRKGGGPPDRND